MNDILDRVAGESNFFKKILSKLPGFKGYVEREERRNADKLLRESIAGNFETIWQRISALQKDAISNGELEIVDDLESAALKLRQFIDRVKTASYGYSGFFDVIKVGTEELNEMYKYDLALLEMEDEVSRAVDNVETSFGTDGLPAAIRHLTSVSQDCVNAFNKRKEVIVMMDTPESTEDVPEFIEENDEEEEN
jgi:hypothetical protein